MAGAETKGLAAARAGNKQEALDWLKQAIAETERELQELRRQAASSIVIPEGGANALKGFGGKGPGGGLQIP